MPPRPPLFGWLIAAAFTVLLNETIIGVALPSFMVAFDVEAEAAQWLISSYLLALGCMLPLTGAVIERLGVTRTLVLAAAGFLAGSVLALTATELWTVVVARIVQAAAGASLLPLLTTTVMRDTPTALRGRTMGVVSLAIGIAPAFGPVVSGLLLAGGDWRWLFAPSALLCAAVLAGALPHWRQTATDVSEATARIDVPSACLAVVAMGTGSVALDSAFSPDLPILPTAVLAALAVAGGWAFVRRQRMLADRNGSPVLDLRALRVPRLVRGVASVATGMAGLFGVFALLPIVAGTRLGIDPVAIGLLLLPGGMLMGILAPMVGRMAERVPPSRLTVPGFVVMAMAAAGFAFLRPGETAMLLALHLALSTGFAFTVTPLYLDALDEQPAALLPHASALMGTAQQVAAAAGTIVVVAIAGIGEAAGFVTAAVMLAGGAAAQARRIPPGLRRTDGGSGT